jgi:hypothetical protein
MVTGTRMSGGVLPALGVQPLMGRVFTQEEDDQHQQVVGAELLDLAEPLSAATQTFRARRLFSIASPMW